MHTMTELPRDRFLYEAILGQQARITTDAEAVLAALRTGETGLPLEVPGATPAATRFLILKGLNGETIQYAEAAGAGESEEPFGWKTMTTAELRSLLAQPGAAAMLFGKVD